MSVYFVVNLLAFLSWILMHHPRRMCITLTEWLQQRCFASVLSLSIAVVITQINSHFGAEVSCVSIIVKGVDLKKNLNTFNWCVWAKWAEWNCFTCKGKEIFYEDFRSARCFFGPVVRSRRHHPINWTEPQLAHQHSEPYLTLKWTPKRIMDPEGNVIHGLAAFRVYFVAVKIKKRS